MDALKLKIKEFDDKLQDLQKHEDGWHDVEKDKQERLAKPEEYKDIPVPKVPTISLDEVKKQKDAASEAKANLDAQLEKLSDSLEVTMSPALKEEKRDNIILLGPTGCGKTTACNYLSQE